LGRVVIEKILHGLEPQGLTRLAHARRRAWRRSDHHHAKKKTVDAVSFLNTETT
jgi:hypothetical protein